MKYATAALALAGAVAVSASPTPTIEKRAEICGQWDSATTGVYTLYQDLWGEDNASSGSQCSEIDSLSGSDIAWHTTWSWEGDSNGVKSYANIVTAFTDEKVSAISSIPTTWKYSYTGTSIVADVSYDLFTSSTSGGSNEYEIMIWLAALGGAGPISSTGSTVATPTIAGSSWKLYSGPNGDTTVYSFVASSEITSFSGDIKDFLTYLVNNESFPSSQYLTSIGAGTEPFTGSDATLTTTQFSLSVK